MKANGIHPQGGTSDKPLSTSSSKERSQAVIARSAAAKRRKIEGDRADCSFDEDEEDGLPRPPKQEPKSEYAQNELMKLENVKHQATSSSNPFSHIPMLRQPSAYYPQTPAGAYEYLSSWVSPDVSSHVPGTQNLTQLVSSFAYRRIPNLVRSADVRYIQATEPKAAVAKLNADEDFTPAISTTQSHEADAPSGKGPCESILIPG